MELEMDIIDQIAKMANDIQTKRNMNLVCKMWNNHLKKRVKSEYMQTIFEAIGMTPDICRTLIETPEDIMYVFDAMVQVIFSPEADYHTRKNEFFETQQDKNKVKYKNNLVKRNRIRRNRIVNVLTLE